jgi:hypothetical protein
VCFVQIGTKALIILPFEVLFSLLLLNSVVFKTSSDIVVKGADSVWRWELDNSGHVSNRDSDDTEGGGGLFLRRKLRSFKKKEDRLLEKARGRVEFMQLGWPSKQKQTVSAIPDKIEGANFGFWVAPVSQQDSGWEAVVF